MDRQIDLVTLQPFTDEAGAPIEAGEEQAFHVLDTVWAAYKPMGGDEKKDGAETRATVDSAFTIYHREDIAVSTHGVVFGRKLYDILFIEEVGRREGLRLKCVLRNANYGDR